MKGVIYKNFQESISLMQRSYLDLSEDIEQISHVIINAYKDNKKVLIAGNGGSAADAQHIAGELVNKFYYDRKPLKAMSLVSDSSVITSWANDKSYDSVFKRQVEAQGDLGDILISISTSGNSKNLIKAVEKANEMRLITVGLLGGGGGELKNLCQYNLIVPSDNTPRVQEVHELIYHTICQIVEEALL